MTHTEVGCLVGFFGAVFAMIWAAFTNANLKATQKTAREEAVKRILADSPDSERYSGSLVGGNHPLLGSVEVELELVLTTDTLMAVVADKKGIAIPLRNVKAQVSQQSNVTAAGIFLFGIYGLAAKDKITVLEVEDEASREHYTVVLKMTDNEAFADQVNRRRYELLTARDQN